jgi:hypothetical protein
MKMNTQKWIATEQTEEEVEPTYEAEAVITFRMRLPVSKMELRHPDKQCVLINAERKMLSLLKCYTLRDLEHLRNNGGWSVERNVRIIEEE